MEVSGGGDGQTFTRHVTTCWRGLIFLYGIFFRSKSIVAHLFPNLFRSYVTYTDLKLAANILYNKNALQLTLLSNNLFVLFKYVSLIMFNALCRHRNELLP